MYRLQLKPIAQKDLDRLLGSLWERIKGKILAQGDNPRPHGYIKLRGDDAYRVRVGDYRILYDIDDDRMIVTILRVKHRRDAYR